MKKLRFKGATYNPIDGIAKGDSYAIEQCNSLAQAIVVRTGDEKETHFIDRAEEFISAIAQVTVEYGQPGRRSLQDVADILANPAKLATATELGLNSPSWGGLLARNAGSLLHAVDKEKASTLSTCSRMLRWLNTPAMEAVTRASSFNPAGLKRNRRGMTVYVVLPFENIKPCAGWLRVVTTSLIHAVVRQGPDEARRVHFVLDESSSLGAHLDCIENLVDKFRKYGCRAQFYYQSFGQLSTCWPKDKGTTLLANAAKIFAGTADYDTAKLISSMLGASTIVTESGGTGISNGHNYGASRGTSGMTDSYGGNSGFSTNDNWQLTKRELLLPEEILTLSPRWCVSFPGGGIRPVVTYLTRAHEEPALFRRPGLLAGFAAACNRLAGAVLLLVLALVLAAALTPAGIARLQALRQPASTPSPASPFYERNIHGQRP